MQLGMVGLGRMGANLVRRLMRDGHRCVVFDVNPDAVARLADEGATGAASIDEFVAALEPPRAVVGHGPRGRDHRAERGRPRGEDGARRRDHRRREHPLPRRHPTRGRALGGAGIHYVDVGTSGGVFGLERGFCLMVGAEPRSFERLEPLFASLAPASTPRREPPGRSGAPAPEEHGYLHCGPDGAGHFVKMVHNGIEYGLMAAYAEGLNSWHMPTRATPPGTRTPRPPRSKTPTDTGSTWTWPGWPRSGGGGAWSARGSWTSPRPRSTARRPWRGSPGGSRTPARAGGPRSRPSRRGCRHRCSPRRLYARFGSRGLDGFANKVLSAMRSEFGGHAEKPS